MGQCAIIEALEKEQQKNEIPEYAVGDTLRVSIKIIEGKRTRVQAFAGTVIAKNGSGLSETVTLYRVAYGSSMERVFNIHSPLIDKLEVTRRGKVRRSKLYHIRGHQGKKAKVEERIVAVKKQKPAPAAPKAEEPPAAQEPEKAPE
ncbi:MAG: 50S ribosomal protein L19 [Simkaniaceae bacterium]|nr:50S ribosomal protein L19 [Simkaniaceae bacterium]